MNTFSSGRGRCASGVRNTFPEALASKARERMWAAASNPFGLGGGRAAVVGAINDISKEEKKK